MFELPKKEDIFNHGIPSTPDDITEIVIKAMGQTENPRLREILTALVKHLHAFGREVKLSDEEFTQALDAVTRLGHLSVGKHNETVVMSDALGFSTLVMILNQNRDADQMSPALLGPFYTRKDPEYPNGFNIARDTPKETDIPLFVRGRVQNKHGKPLANALVEDCTTTRMKPCRPTTCAANSAPTATASFISAPFARPATRFPPTAWSATCCAPRAGTRSARRTCTSPSRLTTTPPW